MPVPLNSYIVALLNPFLGRFEPPPLNNTSTPMLVNIHHLPNFVGSQCLVLGGLEGWNLVEPPIFLR